MENTLTYQKTLGNFKIFSLQPEYFIPLDDRLVTISYDGTLFMSFPFVLTNYCKMKIEEYPFDTQECVIKIVSWAYATEDLYLQHYHRAGSNLSTPVNVRYLFT